MPMLELQLGGLRPGEDALTSPMKLTSFLTIIFAHLRGISCRVALRGASSKSDRGALATII